MIDNSETVTALDEDVKSNQMKEELDELEEEKEFEYSQI
jgi:hypothetical protein